MSEGTLIQRGAAGNIISATGGTVTESTVNGKVYRIHTFTGNDDYELVVNKGSGVVEYKIIADTNEPGGWNTGLDGTTLRHINPFSNVPIFKYVSSQTASSLGYSSNGGSTVGVDDTNRSRAEVQGSCRTNVNWETGFDLHAGGGGRMPTLEEYVNNVLQGSGCGYDNELCWTATKALNDSSSHFLSPGRDPFDRFGGIRAELNSFSSGFLRDVADVDLNRVDPNILQDQDIYDRLVSAGLTPEIVPPPFVKVGRYNLLLGSGVLNKIPNTGPQSSDSKSGINNKGTVVIRYRIG